MRFQVEREVLAEGIGWVARGLAVRPSVPILSGVVVNAEGDTLTLSGFDYEVSTRVELKANVEESGTVLIPGRRLADIAKVLPDVPIEFNVDQTKVYVQCDSNSFVLNALPLDEYPTLPKLPTVCGSVEGDQFARAVSQVAVVASRDDALPVLTGIGVNFDGEIMKLNATDRYRFAIRELAWKPEGTPSSSSVLVPARTLLDFAKSLNKGDLVKIALSDEGNLLGLHAGTRQMTCRLLEGTLPDYEKLFPKEFTSFGAVEVSRLVEALKRVSLVLERNSSVALDFTDGELVLQAGGADDDRATSRMAASLEGESIDIAFNPSFLLDGLTNLDASWAQFSFTSSNGKAVIMGKSSVDAEADTSARYLVMPVRFHR
uniref:Beta sliding clamp homolog GriR n=1 Tax=Streptomyces muensis TaxID=1077944 RepID=GRIR_STRM4|nr:RecName: Full=Beta sliding clamp homolog GriR; Short=Beta clamp GriR; Short=Sliding clamp GriR [Streptomyces muensis]AKC91855.1 DNA polymerase III beta subunit [Streptomyces muensis]